MTDKRDYSIIYGVPHFLTASEAADRFGVSSKTILRWVASGKLRGVTLPSGRIRIPEDAIDEHEAAAS